jgi:hypothetical protein
MALTPEQQALDFNPELQDVTRQRKLADMLMAKGFDQPQGQMISGYYVAPSFTQQINPMANMLAGQSVANRADTQELKLAETLRNQQKQEINEFGELLKTDPNKAYQFAAQSKVPQLREAGLKKLMPQEFDLAEGAKRYMTLPDGTVKEIASGTAKYHAPTSVDMGTLGSMLIFPDGRREMVQKGVQGPAGQVVESGNGPMLVNTRTGQAMPVMANGQPLAPKLNAEQTKDITSINQQYSTIDGALKAVEETPQAFSFGRGSAQNLPFGESLAGRFDKPKEAEARAYVFNNVSAVIKERAGTAQSASEMQRINSFMPAVTDNAKQIENKLTGFKTYLKDLEKGTRVNPNISMQSALQTPQAPKRVVNFNDLP